MVDGVFGRKVGCAEIEIAVCHKDLKIGVVGHRRSQPLAYVYELSFEIGVRPGVYEFADDLIG